MGPGFVVSWMDQVKSQRPIVVGPVVTQTQAQAQVQDRAQAQAHLANLTEKSHLEAIITSNPNGWNERMVCVQGTSGSGKTSREPGATVEGPMVVPKARMRAKFHSCPVAEFLATILVASHSDWEVERRIGDDLRNALDSNSPGQLKGMDKGSHPSVPSPENTSVNGNPLYPHQWKVSNQFSPLNNLGREGDPWSEEVEEVFTEVPSISDKEGCDS